MTYCIRMRWLLPPGSGGLKGEHTAKYSLYLAHSQSSCGLQGPICLLGKCLGWGTGTSRATTAGWVRNLPFFLKVFYLSSFYSYLNYVLYFIFQAVFHITINLMLTDEMSQLRVFPKQRVLL